MKLHGRINIVFALLLCVSSLVSILPISAQSSNTALNELQNLHYILFDESSNEVLISNKYDRDISDWYIIALTSIEKIDNKDEIISSIDEYIINNNDLNITSKARIALTYVALGVKNDFVYEVAYEDISKAGLTAKIFCCILNFNINGDRANKILSEIIKVQNEDGGWSLIEGKPSEVDLTAMALCALSFDKDNYENEINDALNYLSKKQRESGGYASYNIENAESAAQVIIALCSCNIDILSDARFIKNGKSILDALLEFRVDNGAYTHSKGGSENTMATVQAYMALVSAVKNTMTHSSFYDFSVTCNPILSQNDFHSSLSFGFVFKIVSVSCLLLLTTIYLIVMLARHKSKKSILINMVLILCIVIIFSVVIINLDIRMPDEYYAQNPPITDEIIRVYVTIDCSNAIGKVNNSLPENGIIINEYEIKIGESSSAYEAIVAVCRENKIRIDSSSGYIKGINFLYEKDCGENSGWIYSVNGTIPGVSSSSYVLSDGDKLVVAYTCDMGLDIK